MLDSSVLSVVFRRAKASEPHPVVQVFRELVEDDHAMAIPGVVFQEILSGVKSNEGFRRIEDALSGFPLLLADRSAHRRAAQVRNACRAAGITAASFDCVIAAQTLIGNAELFTLDTDFVHISKVTGLRLKPW